MTAGIERISLNPWKVARQSDRIRVDAEGHPGGNNALKKTMIAVLAGALLLSAAMPAFAKKHHKHHHHHHSQHSSQPAR
jgi:hypothetical protein